MCPASDVFLCLGAGASPGGTEPFLDILDIDSGEKKRIWQSSAPYYASCYSFISPSSDEPISSSDMQLMMAKEGKQERQQILAVQFSNDKSMATRYMTQFPHPYPHVLHPTCLQFDISVQMMDVHSEIIRYKRPDGLNLTATLYLPVGYDKDRDGPLPCLMWVYPEDFKSKVVQATLSRLKNCL